MGVREEMQAVYKVIEQKIKDAGYPGKISGEDFYDDIASEAGNHEPGTYIVWVKKNNTISYEACLDNYENQFDLHYVNIHLGDAVFRVDFD